MAILAIAGALFPFANSSGSLSLGGKKVMVPNVVGMSMEEAQSTLTSDDYKLTVGTITYQQSDTVKEGQVISQDPKANSAVKEGQAVNLVVSAGATTATVPDLSGMTASQAEAALAKAGLTGNSQSGYSDKVELGKVFNQDPAAGSTVPAGSTVTYTISAGEEVSTVAVPSVIGLTKDVAVATLQGVGLQVNVETGSSSDTGGTSVAAGEVYSQSISQGTRVEKGSSITIYVNKEQQKPSTSSSNNSSAGSNNNGSSNNSSEDNGGKTDSGSEDNSNTENSNTGDSKE